VTDLDALVLAHYQLWLALTAVPWVPTAIRYTTAKRYFTGRGLGEGWR
jgi:hypothetical protein